MYIYVLFCDIEKDGRFRWSGYWQFVLRIVPRRVPFLRKCLEYTPESYIFYCIHTSCMIVSQCIYRSWNGVGLWHGLAHRTCLRTKHMYRQLLYNAHGAHNYPFDMNDDFNGLLWCFLPPWIRALMSHCTKTASMQNSNKTIQKRILYTMHIAHLIYIYRLQK